MDKNDLIPPISILDTLRPGNLHLSLHGKPFVQSQDHRWSIGNAVFTDYDLFLCTGGSATFTLNTNSYHLKPGRILLCPPGVRISAKKTSPENFQAIAQHFSLQLGGGGDFFQFIQVKPLVNIPEPLDLTQEYLRFTEVYDQPRSSVLKNSIFLSILFTYIHEAYLGETTYEGRNIRFVFDIASRLENALTRPDAVDFACDPVPLSRDYAVRMFRKHFGIPPKEYLLRCRMNAARDSLLSGNPIKQTAFQCGFKDELYFSRFFSRREGVCPREYLRRNGVGKDR